MGAATVVRPSDLIGPDGHIVISRWDNYTKHVVDPALKELRQIAGFDVSVFYKRGASQGRRIERIVLTAMRKSKLTYALLDDDASTPLHTAHMNLKASEEDTLRVSSLRIAKKTDLSARGTDNGQKFTRNTHASGGHDVWSAAIERACESEKRHAAGVPEEINRRPDPRKWRTMNAENLRLIEKELALHPPAPQWTLQRTLQQAEERGACAFPRERSDSGRA